MRYYDDPVILRNITPVSGRIQWARHLAQRIEEPMEIFKQHPSVFQGPQGRRVVHMYNRVSQVLLEYEMLYHSAWLKTIDVVDEGLSGWQSHYKMSTCLSVNYSVSQQNIFSMHSKTDSGQLSLLRE